MANFDTERRIEAEQLLARINEIRDTVYSQRQPVKDIQICVTGKNKGPERAPKAGWKPYSPTEFWGGYDQTTWFKINVVVPKHFAGQKVVALFRIADVSFIPGMTGLTEGGESICFVNGVPFQGLDRNRDELFLTNKAKGGEKFELTLEACPSTRFDLNHVFKHADIAIFNQLAWDYYWDAIVALEVYQELDKNFAPARQLLELITESLLMVDLQNIGDKRYIDSLGKAQKKLRAGLKNYEHSYGMGKLVLAGHAHIDTAWLWPLRETKRKCGRTFSTVLNLMDRYPEFHFSCSQAVQYHWVKEYFPELYARIKKRVKEGRWELCGAPWVEPDHNVPSGESLIRQYLIGNRFFEQEFGMRSHIAWVPDSFGYTWQLPQIMTKCGLTAFVTTKIDWSQFTAFPYSMFQWEGADGTKILAVMPPLNYNGNPVPKDCIAQWSQFKQKEHVEELPFPFGWGDGGGGPTMNMIEHGRRLKNIVGVPKVEFGRLEDTVDRMAEQAKSVDLPVYNGELYLELHRACQTTQARTKRNNRKCEFLLHDAEMLSCLAHLSGGGYDASALLDAWRIVLTNQFHDILPGSSITEVYAQADIDYAEANGILENVLKGTLKHLVNTIDTSGEGQAVIVFNTLSWVRNDVAVVATKLPSGKFSVIDSAGHPVPCQKVGKDELIFEARDLPPLGYAVFRIVPDARKVEHGEMLEISTTSMENDFIRIRIDKSGCLTSIFDKVEERECLPKGERGNVLQLFDDRPHLHDAWDFDHNFEDKMWEPAETVSIKVIETGPVRGAVRVIRKTEHSTFTQDIIMYANRPRVDFATHVDWQEKRTLLKVAFPVDVRATRATYEIQYATIERPTHHNTAHDRARFEVPAQKWADLSEGNYGFSLINDCKYGYDVKDNVIRLSLLRASIDPDPLADEGEHEFTYAIYPHPDDWRSGTIQESFELNVPVMAIATPSRKGALPENAAFASLDVDNVIIDTLKKAEDSDAIIVRLYEAYGQRGGATMTFGQTPKRVTECNFMEEEDKPVKLKGNSIDFFVTPYEIRTFKVQF